MALPKYIAVPLERDWAAVYDETIVKDFSTDPESFTVAPSTDSTIWLVYAIRYGVLDPAGPTKNFSLKFNHEDITKHSTEMVHSVLDYVHDTLIKITTSQKLKITSRNNTGQTQTLDFKLMAIKFTSDADFEAWKDWFNENYVKKQQINVEVEEGDEGGEGGAPSAPNVNVTGGDEDGDAVGTCKWPRGGK